MTVDPKLRLTPGEYLIHPDGSASRVVDRRNMTVDEILASGRYTDRRGRAWARSPHASEFGEYWYMPIGPDNHGQTHHIAYLAEMRLLIERDQHRRLCIGLSHCDEHPSASVVWGRKERQWIVFKPYGWANDDGIFYDHAAAMDAARALAVGE